MSRAVCSDIQYVEPGGCCRSRMVFRSVWDRLCQQLFGAIPPGMDTEDILPDITIWQEGVILQEEEGGEFSFTVTTSEGEAPKPQDVILYKGKYYIVGEVVLTSRAVRRPAFAILAPTRTASKRRTTSFRPA